MDQGPANHGWVIGKPKGLWLSVEGEADWKAWCEGESFSLDRLANSAEVILKPNANVLHLKSVWEIREFGKEFWTKPYPEASFWVTAIDWIEVAKRYQGIIIAPYQWSIRLHDDFYWYYSWDCASGCIWDVSCIQEIKALQSTEVTA